MEMKKNSSILSKEYARGQCFSESPNNYYNLHLKLSIESLNVRIALILHNSDKSQN